MDDVCNGRRHRGKITHEEGGKETNWGACEEVDQGKDLLGREGTHDDVIKAEKCRQLCGMTWEKRN